MLERSAQAPGLWSMENSEVQIRSQVLESNPDLVLFQELPGMVPYIETHDMLRSNPRTHQGYLASLVRRPLLSPAPVITTVAETAVLATFGSLTVANVHLVSGRGAWEPRLEQLSAVVAASPTEQLVVIGDTNVRIAEEEAIAELGLRGSLPPTHTWNSHSNRFHLRGARFTASFSRWFATGGVTVDEVQVLRAPIVHDEHRFWVSDHFALLGRVSVGAP